ncbi:MAG: hypothetical protein KBD66_03115 [Candidatus Doudnabacteria bacterium]|nr:hypothetical protein [Candidatus Doudnabacteria bacterium]
MTSGDVIRIHQVSPSGIVPRTLVYKGGEARLRQDIQDGSWVAGTTMGPGEQFNITFSDGKTRAFSGIRGYNETGWVTGE